jgi:hypothetical protein
MFSGLCSTSVVRSSAQAGRWLATNHSALPFLRGHNGGSMPEWTLEPEVFLVLQSVGPLIFADRRPYKHQANAQWEAASLLTVRSRGGAAMGHEESPLRRRSESLCVFCASAVNLEFLLTARTWALAGVPSNCRIRLTVPSLPTPLHSIPKPLIRTLMLCCGICLALRTARLTARKGLRVLTWLAPLALLLRLSRP